MSVCQLCQKRGEEWCFANIENKEQKKLKIKNFWETRLARLSKNHAEGRGEYQIEYQSDSTFSPISNNSPNTKSTFSGILKINDPQKDHEFMD